MSFYSIFAAVTIVIQEFFPLFNVPGCDQYEEWTVINIYDFGLTVVVQTAVVQQATQVWTFSCGINTGNKITRQICKW